MEKLAALGGGAFVIASLVIGLRLIWVAIRQREFAALCIGAGLLLMGGLGYPMSLWASRAGDMGEGTRSALIVANLAFSVVGNGALCLFNWKVFRPHSAAALGLALGIAFALLVLMILQGFSPGYLAWAESREGPWEWKNAIGLVVYAWAAWEPGRYFLRLRRQVALGLADPVVADRFRLWSLGIGSALAINTMTLVCRLAGVNVMTATAPQLVIAILGTVAAVSVWVAFLPPAGYRRRLMARAPGTA